MDSGFVSWERDPFFAAAEDVQLSADRMESTYRAWLHSKAIAEGHTGNAMELKNAEVSWRELTTALDTAKWQLEEFKKAATEASIICGSQMREDASKRHFSFIDAIQGQISMTENSVYKFTDPKTSNSLYSVNFNDEERDQLAMFLSGCPSNGIHSVNDGRIHPIEENHIENSSPSIVSNPHPYSDVAKKKEHRLKPQSSNEQYGTRVSGLSSTSNGFTIMDTGGEHGSNEEIVEVNEISSFKEFDGQSLPKEGDWPNMDYSKKLLTTDKIMNDLDPWNSVGELREIDKFQTSRNGFKRWKNGYHGLNVEEERLMINDTGLLFDVEKGDFSGGLRTNRKSSSGHGLKKTNVLGRWTVQQQLRPFFETALRPSARRAMATVVALCLCCMYFWILSSLVPYMNTVFPYKFQD